MAPFFLANRDWGLPKFLGKLRAGGGGVERYIKWESLIAITVGNGASSDDDALPTIYPDFRKIPGNPRVS